MKGQRIGYVRVSGYDQNPDRQLEMAQVDKVFTDKASGKDTQRPELDALLAFVREGNTVVVHSMDRLARNLDGLRSLVQKLPNRGVRIEFIKECLTFTGEDSPMANLMLSVMGAFAELKRRVAAGDQKTLLARDFGISRETLYHTSRKPPRLKYSINVRPKGDNRDPAVFFAGQG